MRRSCQRATARRDRTLHLDGSNPHVKVSGDEDLVFPSLNGTPLRMENLRRRVLKPVAEEVGAPWAGFHTFRHTAASLLFKRGQNSAAFTLATYVHLLDDRIGEPLLPLQPARETPNSAKPAYGRCC